MIFLFIYLFGRGGENELKLYVIPVQIVGHYFVQVLKSKPEPFIYRLTKGWDYISKWKSKDYW